MAPRVGRSVDRPLGGRTILVTGSGEPTPPLAAALESAGASVISLETIAIGPPDDLPALDAALARLTPLWWVVLTSANGVRQVLARPAGRALGGSGARVAAVGPATRRALEAAGVPVAWVSPRPSGAALARGLPCLAGESVLLLRSDLADDEPVEILRLRGAAVTAVVAYRTRPRTEVDPTLVDRLGAEGLDAAVLASPSSVRGLLAAVGHEPRSLANVALVSIGPTTSRAIGGHGLTVAVEAAEPSPESSVCALVDYFNRRSVDRGQRSPGV